MKKNNVPNRIPHETLAAWKADGLEYEDVMARIAAHCDNPVVALQCRNWCVLNYAWGIPNDAAIQTLVDLSPICDIGAGGGYWAYRVAQAGGVITAFDVIDWQTLPAYPTAWSPIQMCAPAGGTTPPNKTLMLCWPMFNKPYATDNLRAYEGDRVVYIGEPQGGACANDEFHQLLQNDWKCVTTIQIPQFPHINDRMEVYTRAIS